MTHEAKAIIDGFMSRFPAPECREQQEVVDAANKWLVKYAEMEKHGQEFFALLAKITKEGL